MKTKKSKIFVSHGMVTHRLGTKCKECAEVRREFEKDLKSGKIVKILTGGKKCR